MSREKIAIIYGTRPEFLKVFPLINYFKLKQYPITIINTGQHDSMLTELEQSFSIEPNFRIKAQSSQFTNANLLAKLINDLSEIINQEEIQKVIAQGDTFTVLASSIVSFIEKRNFYHVEAGLRTSNINLPFPEEYNRRVVSLGATINFAPTKLSYNNLINERVPVENVIITGNTIVDMIQHVLKLKNISITYEDYVFITAHRRENIGTPLQNIVKAVQELAIENPTTTFHWALHPNPNTQKIIKESFFTIPNNIKFTGPLDYFEAIKIMAKSKLIISDSGGIQEEAPSLNKKVIILRNETERPEVTECGCGTLVGSSIEKIKETYSYINNNNYIFSSTSNPFGDGKASERIFNQLTQ